MHEGLDEAPPPPSALMQVNLLQDGNERGPRGLLLVTVRSRWRRHVENSTSENSTNNRRGRPHGVLGRALPPATLLCCDGAPEPLSREVTLRVLSEARLNSSNIHRPVWCKS